MVYIFNKLKIVRIYKYGYVKERVNVAYKHLSFLQYIVNPKYFF